MFDSNDDFSEPPDLSLTTVNRTSDDQSINVENSALSIYQQVSHFHF